MGGGFVEYEGISKNFDWGLNIYFLLKLNFYIVELKLKMIECFIKI